MPAPTRNGPNTLLSWEAIAQGGRVPILLVRHGQTAWNVEGRFLGKSDVPLDDDGRQQARWLADWLAPLPLQGIVSSPLARAAETAKTVADSRTLGGPQWEGRLAELDQGDLEGHYGKQLPERWPDFFQAWVADPAEARVPGGETLRECHERSWQAIRALAAGAEPGPPLMVVSHKMVITTLVCRMLDLPLRCFRLIGQDNTAVNLLSYGDGGLRLHLLNATEHLPAP